jgi:hypothetical protein
VSSDIPVDGSFGESDEMSSWYHDGSEHRHTYDRILHVVMDPLHEIESRASKILTLSASQIEGMVKATSKSEDSSRLHEIFKESDHNETKEKVAYQLALEYWVNRNSHLDLYASWRECIEDLVNDPLSVWRMCTAGGFGNECPNLNTIRYHLQNTDKQKMELNQGTGRTTWEKLSAILKGEFEDYLLVAKEMAKVYGYELDHNHNQSSQLKYHCGLNNDEKWECHIPAI